MASSRHGFEVIPQGLMTAAPSVALMVGDLGAGLLGASRSALGEVSTVTTRNFHGRISRPLWHIISIFQLGMHMSDLDDVRAIVQSHYSEVAQGFVDKTASTLSRGEGIQKRFYIVKIDLAESTAILAGRRPETYLKVAHTFLSSIDRIARQFGADGEQVEYQGDSVIAYFPERIRAEEVLKAACLMRAAVTELSTLDRTMGSLNLRCKIVIDFALLIVAKIGPRASSVVSAIGHPIHLIAKIEKTIGPDTGRVTPAFRARVERRFWMCMPAIRGAAGTAVPATAGTASPTNYSTAFSALIASVGIQPPPSRPDTSALVDALMGRPTVRSSQVDLASVIRNGGLLPTPAMTPPSPPLGEIIGYNIAWVTLYRQLGIA